MTAADVRADWQAGEAARNAAAARLGKLQAENDSAVFRRDHAAVTIVRLLIDGDLALPAASFATFARLEADADVALDALDAWYAGVDCSLCHAHYGGDRTAARAARWETYSTRTQHDMDAGPLVCPTCVGRALEDLSAALRDAIARGVDL